MLRVFEFQVQRFKICNPQLKTRNIIIPRHQALQNEVTVS